MAGPRHRHLLPWVPTLHFYYPLGAIAAWKAIYELIVVPFYWDKTQHGHSLVKTGSGTATDPATVLAFRSCRVQFQPGHEGL